MNCTVRFNDSFFSVFDSCTGPADLCYAAKACLGTHQIPFTKHTIPGILSLSIPNRLAEPHIVLGLPAHRRIFSLVDVNIKPFYSPSQPPATL